MRITTGIAGGREILVPKTTLRPTQDKVRQALFSSLGEGISGCRFLDLFAGSGAVGIEAWSRGAAFACLVEQDPRAVEAIGRNIRALNVPADAVNVIRADVERFLSRSAGLQKFDIVFADPPYEGRDAGGRRTEGGRRRGVMSLSWAEKVLSLVGRGSILRAGGFLIFEQGDDEPVREGAGWKIIQDRRYGSARLVFYTLAGDEGTFSGAA